MFQTFLKSAIALVCIAPAFGAEGWVTNLDEAKKLAKENNKLVLAEFTGSDWCSPCKTLKQNVMDTPEFIKEASKDFILLELDYPRNKEQSPEQKEANNKAKDLYGIRGFPTILYLNADGEPVGGFIGGVPKDAVLASMEQAKKNKVLIETAKKTLNSDAPNEEKAAALVKVYDVLNPQLFDKMRQSMKEEILKLDPQDTTGFGKILAKEKADAEMMIKIRDEMRAYFEANMKNRENYKTIGDIVKNLRTNMEKVKLSPQAKQLVVIQNSRVYVSAGMLDEAEKFLEEAISWDPDSEFATKLKSDLVELKKERPENEKKVASGEYSMDMPLIPATKTIAPSAPKDNATKSIPATKMTTPSTPPNNAAKSIPATKMVPSTPAQ